MYKKIKKVAPFAVLSTAILLSPAATTFAAEKTQPDIPTVQTKNMDGDGGGIGGGQHGGDHGGSIGTGDTGDTGVTGSPFDEAQLKKDVLERAKAAVFNNPGVWQPKAKYGAIFK